LGANFNLHKLDFRNKKDFFEENQDLSSLIYDVNFNEDLISFGNGFSFQFGGILKIKNIRLGVTYDSPQWIDLQDETQQKLSAYRYEDGLAIKEIIDPDITNSYSPYRLKIPSKTTLSFAYIFNLAGLISLDYSTQNFSQTYVSQEGTSGFLNSLNEETNKILNPVNTLKIGGEYRLKNVSLRGGYFYQTKNQDTNENGNQALTFGIGFDFGGSNLNLSLVKFQQNRDFTVFSKGLTSPYSIKENLTRFTLSYNFKL
jgi:long-subunit fatty acid transport protein